MKNLVIFTLLLCCLFLIIQIHTERINPQVKEMEGKIKQMELLQEATIETCADYWLKEPISKKEMEKIKDK